MLAIILPAAESAGEAGEVLKDMPENFELAAKAANKVANALKKTKSTIKAVTRGIKMVTKLAKFASKIGPMLGPLGTALSVVTGVFG